ncbi:MULTISPECIES: MarR family winged helix-turn-helix transcriptional regulator [unclassified Exiguobacterium]|uniref:MarR family winged helix-turn-helix transcriptional regulator n=1 Tax=unclassified Exiguobacterium TaxID=2644629 RepID=UPI000B58D6C3|nr:MULTISPECIES: MarR family transcriptional regulator [unclassified Exiguobacterium]ASI35379.1 MarR family transcriptional regulator [Exiguobacterium sp. N4-1P]ASI37392.1 MarR family transcriptional regulator [Exiguobacterium sp. N4-1P]
MEQPNPNLKALTVMVRAVDALHEVIKKDVAKSGLNPTDFSVLELLYHKGRQPIQLIGKKVLITSSSITYVINKLEKKNYVVRQACPTDRRVTFAELTTEGRELMDTIFPEHEKTINQVFEGIDPSDIEALINTAKKVGYQAQNH